MTILINIFIFKYLHSVITLIIDLVICLAIFITLGITLKNKNLKIKNLPISIVWILLVIMEIMEIYYLIGKDNGFFQIDIKSFFVRLFYILILFIF